MPEAKKLGLDVPAGACAIQVVRWVGESGIRYSDAVVFSTDSPAATIAMYYRRCRVFGGVATSDEKTVGLCDILDAEMDVLSNFELTEKGVTWLCHELGLTDPGGDSTTPEQIGGLPLRAPKNLRRIQRRCCASCGHRVIRDEGAGCLREPSGAPWRSYAAESEEPDSAMHYVVCDGWKSAEWVKE